MNKFQTLKGRLERAHYEILEALKLANKITKCCGDNIEISLIEIEKSISEVDHHIKKGINEKDLIK